MAKYDVDFFRKALDSVRDLILIKGERSRLLWANKSFLEYYGMSEEQLYQIIDGPQSDPDDTLQYIRDDQTVFDIKGHLNVPSEMVTNSNGESFPFHTIKSPVFEKGKVEKIVGISRRIDDENIKNTTYPHQDAKIFSTPLRSITSNFPTPMILLDTQGRVVNSSPLWRKTFDDQFIDEQAKFFDEIYPDLFDVSDKIMNVLNNKESIVEQLVSLFVNSEKFYFLFRLSSWSYPNGVLGGVTITATDISDVKKAQDQLEKLNNELLKSNKDLDSFAYSACHDLKSPLKAIKHLATWISEDKENVFSEQSGEDLVTLQERAVRMGHLLEALFLYSQFNRKEYEVETLNICQEVNDIKKILNIPKDFKISFCSKNIHVKVRGIPFRLVLRNLIDNAIKHHDKSRGQVKVYAVSHDDEIEISVSDNGPGIPVIHRERIFELFKTLKPRDEVEGSGIGLSLVKKVLEKEGGHIKLSNNETNGTTFIFNFPIVEDHIGL